MFECNVSGSISYRPPLPGCCKFWFSNVVSLNTGQRWVSCRFMGSICGLILHIEIKRWQSQKSLHSCCLRGAYCSWNWRTSLSLYICLNQLLLTLVSSYCLWNFTRDTLRFFCKVVIYKIGALYGIPFHCSN